MMTEKDLDAIIDKAPVKKIRQCLKYIVGEWFVEEDSGTRTVNFDKELNSNSLAAVTDILCSFGFCPPPKTKTRR